jgi:hypothetical protein
VIVPVMVVLPELIVNGIERVSVLDVYVGADTLTFALASVKVPV